MAVKDNIEFLKEEISNEEKMLEQVVKIERFYKKYKKQILAIVAILIVGGIGYGVYDLKQSHDLKVSNEAYIKLLKNPNDKESLNILKEKNPRLYTLFIFQEAVKKGDIDNLKKIASKKIFPLSNIAKYQEASLTKSKKDLEDYEYNQKALLKDMAILNEAFLLYEENNIKKAKEKLNLINEKSLLYPYAKFLLHYGIKGS